MVQEKYLIYRADKLPSASRNSHVTPFLYSCLDVPLPLLFAWCLGQHPHESESTPAAVTLTLIRLRSAPKHTLPAMPRPTFYPPHSVGKGPSPPARGLHCLGMASNYSNSSRSSVTRRSESVRIRRGPWDHSGSVRVPIDVDHLLPLPKPVAIGASRQ